MSYFYEVDLLVRPFITAPIGHRQQAFVLSHADHTVNAELFMASMHRQLSREQPSLPIVCEVRRFGRYLLASTTINTLAVERVTGRSGTSLCFGVLVDMRLPHRNTLQQAYNLFATFFREFFNADLSPEGAARVLEVIQETPSEPIPLSSLTLLVQAFEERFGLAHGGVASRFIVGNLARWYARGRSNSFASFSNAADVRSNWQNIDSFLSPSRSRSALPLGWRDAAIVSAGPIAVGACFVVHSLTLSIPNAAHSRFLLDVATILLALCAIGAGDVARRETHRAALSTAGRLRFWVLSTSTGLLVLFLILIAVEAFASW